ncbi:MAG: cobalamin biosynthesis protein [Arenimonas sp.]
MALTLIAVVLALVMGHIVPGLMALRRYGWFVAWLGMLGNIFRGNTIWQGRFGTLIAIGVPVIIIAVIQYFLSGLWYGLPSFVFSLMVLLYTWGPRDLDLDVDKVVDAPDVEARRQAAAALFPEGDEPVLEGASLVEAVFRCALWRWFGVLFWFLILGAAGALLYRLTSLSAQGESRKTIPEMQSQAAALFTRILNWPVAHLMTFGMALAANFDTVLSAWREWYKQSGRTRLDIGFLGAAARASVDCELAEEDAYAVDGPAQAPALLELRDAMSLVWRILLLWLAVLSLFVLAGFVN